MLRLVTTEKEECAVASFAAAESEHIAERALRAEARAIQAWRGKNPYSDFLQKHGRRPSPDEAATIGLLMGARVKAADGTMQPMPSKARRAQTIVERKLRASERKMTARIFQVRKAILALAANHHCDSSLIIDSVGRELGEDNMHSQLAQALSCLNQILEEYRRREESKPQRDS